MNIEGHINIIEQELKSLKTRLKDSVEVVRCKDCKFHTYEEIGMVYCPTNIVGGWVEDDFFCKDGERKEE